MKNQHKIKFKLMKLIIIKFFIRIKIINHLLVMIIKNQFKVKIKKFRIQIYQNEKIKIKNNLINQKIYSIKVLMIQI